MPKKPKRQGACWNLPEPARIIKVQWRTDTRAVIIVREDGATRMVGEGHSPWVFAGELARFLGVPVEEMKVTA
jgi:hypothetical protein